MDKYYTVCGTWEVTKDEQFNPEALLRHHAVTVVSTSYEEAVAYGDLMVQTHGDVDSYLIPQRFDGRLYNLTDQDVPIADNLTLYRQEKLEWQNYRQAELA
jgi:hypothetical protein